MNSEPVVIGLATALGLGLMIGIVRERHDQPDTLAAGSRTHAVLALLGAVTASLQMGSFIAGLLVVGALAFASYLRSAPSDPGLTGEVAIVLTFVLGGFAMQQPKIAAATGVLVAILLKAKQPLRRFSRELVSERELRDALMLAAAALVVLPLLPNRPIDPWGMFNPSTLWRIAVLIMMVGMLGHIAARAVGTRWGLPIAGFFSGFASSTAAVAGFGGRARAQPEGVPASATAALLANLASLLLLAAVIGAVSPRLLASMAMPLAAAAMGLGIAAALGLRHDPNLESQTPPDDGPFRLWQALAVAGVISIVLVVSAWLQALFGQAGALAATTVAALAELHAAGASIAQIEAGGGLDIATARWGVAGIITASAVAKSVIAFASGGARYGCRVAAGLAMMAMGAAVGVIGSMS